MVLAAIIILALVIGVALLIPVARRAAEGKQVETPRQRRQLALAQLQEKRTRDFDELVEGLREKQRERAAKEQDEQRQLRAERREARARSRRPQAPDRGAAAR